LIDPIPKHNLSNNQTDRGFDQNQTKDYNIGICCFSANHAALRRKSKDWVARNQDNTRAERNVYPWTVASVS